MEYFREEINLTDSRKEKRIPPLGEVYKDVECEFRFPHVLFLRIANWSLFLYLSLSNSSSLHLHLSSVVLPGQFLHGFPGQGLRFCNDFWVRGSRARQSFAAKLPKRNLLVMFKKPLWWLRMLIEELHCSFFFGEIIVYGVIQGLSKGLGFIDQCCNGFWLQETTLFHIRWTFWCGTSCRNHCLASDGNKIYRTSGGEIIHADCHFLCVGKPLSSQWLSGTVLKDSLGQRLELSNVPSRTHLNLTKWTISIMDSIGWSILDNSPKNAHNQ
ncbi:hypothetical protein YC2023_079488 [Brassica napus]